MDPTNVPPDRRVPDDKAPEAATAPFTATDAVLASTAAITLILSALSKHRMIDVNEFCTTLDDVGAFMAQGKRRGSSVALKMITDSIRATMVKGPSE